MKCCNVLLVVVTVACLSSLITWYVLDSQHAISVLSNLSPESVRLLFNKHFSTTSSSTTFNHYKFSLQWPPSACNSIMTCSGTIPAEFTIHGLWPQDANDDGVPSYTKNPSCTKLVPVPEANLISYLPSTLQTSLTQKWPNLKNNKIAKENQIFWGYEWRQHGMCSDYADQPAQYFQIALDLKNKLSSATLGLQVGQLYTAADIVKVVKTQIGGKIPEIVCSKDKITTDILLWEVRICYKKDMPPHDFIDCPTQFSGPYCKSATTNIRLG